MSDFLDHFKPLLLLKIGHNLWTLPNSNQGNKLLKRQINIKIFSACYIEVIFTKKAVKCVFKYRA